MSSILYRLFNAILRSRLYKVFHKALFGDLEYRLYRLNQFNIQTAYLHQQTFLPFKNIHNGRDICIVACGPSGEKFIPVDHAIYIAVNRAIRLSSVKFDYLFFQDGGLCPREFVAELNTYVGNNCKKFYGIQTPDRWRNSTSESDAIKAGALRFNIDSMPDLQGYEAEFPLDLSTQPLGDFGSTVFAAIQFALWTNPKRIYLVGCDCTAIGHFYEKSVKTNLPIQQMLNGYNKLKSFARVFYPDTEIISVNPVGLRGLFKDWDQDKGPLE